jgi:catechol-2,3-dioxygenase
VTRRLEEPDRRAWMRVLGVPLEIAQIPAWPPLEEAQRRALPAISFLVRPQDLDDLVTHLRDLEVPVHGPVLKQTGESVGAYFSDPDGNPLSFSVPNGYPPDGLSRNPRLWVVAPYSW